MEERLRSITKQIHWSLAVKAAVFGVVWYFSPGWFFFLVALYMYFIPPFNSAKLLAPFATLTLLCLVQPKSLIFMVIAAALFTWILLIRDLIFIDRKSAYEILVFALSFFLVRFFYVHAANPTAGKF